MRAQKGGPRTQCTNSSKSSACFRAHALVPQAGTPCSFGLAAWGSGAPMPPLTPGSLQLNGAIRRTTAGQRPSDRLASERANFHSGLGHRRRGPLRLPEPLLVAESGRSPAASSSARPPAGRSRGASSAPGPWRSRSVDIHVDEHPVHVHVRLHEPAGEVDVHVLGDHEPWIPAPRVSA